MGITISKYAEALALTLKDEKDNARVKEKMQNLLKLLVKRKQTRLIKRLEPEFRNIWLKTQGKLEVKVTLPSEPSDKDKADLAKSLGDALGKEIIMSVGVDERVMGGMKLEFEDYVIDGTILKNLELLKLNLTSHGS